MFINEYIIKSRLCLFLSLITVVTLGNSISYSAEPITGFGAEPITGFGHALNLDSSGNGQDIIIEQLSDPIVKKQTTIEAWFKTKDSKIANEQILISLENNNQKSSIELGIENGGRVRTSAQSQGEWTHVVSSSSQTVGDAQWHHVVGIVSKQTVSLYLDGQLISAKKGLATENTDLNDTFVIRLGNDGNPNRIFKGQLDEVRIWNIARSEADINQTRYQTLQGNEPGLVAYFNFDEGSGTETYDKVNNLTGTLNKMVDGPTNWWVDSELTIPITIQEDSTFNGLLPAYDKDSNLLTYHLIDNDDQKGTVTLTNANTGAFTYTPPPNYYGEDKFSYQVNDGSSDSNPTDVIMMINEINDAPSFLASDPPPVNENAGPQTITNWAQFEPGTDEKQAVDFYTVTKISNSRLFAIEPSVDVNGNLNYTPADDTWGTSTFRVTVKDDGGTDFGGKNVSEPQTFTIAIKPMATTSTVTDAVTTEDKQTNHGLVIDNQGDSSVTHFHITNIVGGTLFQSNGIKPINEGDFITVAQGHLGLRFTPAPNWFGQASFDIQAAVTPDDSGLGGDIVTATITVQPVADEPSVTPANTLEGIQTTKGLVISPHPADGKEVTHFKITRITGGQLSHHDGVTPINNGDFITFAQGQAGLKFIPNSTANGHFQVQAATTDDDSGLGGNPVTATITVGLINEPPILDEIDNQTVQLGQLLSFTAIANDFDIPVQNLTFSLENAPLGATIDSRTGQFTWIPTVTGIFEVTVIVTDNGINPDNLSDSKIITITVTKAPVLEPLDEQIVPVETAVTFTAKATYPGAEPLIFDLIESPEGAMIDEETGEFFWIPSQTGDFDITIQVTEPFGNLSTTTNVMIIVVPIETTLELSLNSTVIFQNGMVEISGQLNLFPDTKLKLADLPIQLTITAPNGHITTQTTSLSPQGKYTVTDLSAFNQLGHYIVQTNFAGTEQLFAAQSAKKSLLVSALAGYALLIQGRLADGSGIAAYNKSLNRVYQQLKNRHFVDSNIDYFNYNPDQEGVDAIPSKTQIATTFEQLPHRLNANPAPLYIVMINHGSLEGYFYLDNGDGEKITTTELHTWLTQLEHALTPQALAQPRIIIIGSCYSGQFLSTLAAPGRVIITSTTSGEESYKGPLEPDGIRSGEFFIEALFAHLGRGKSLKTAFELASLSTEMFTRWNDSNSFNHFFQDNAAQHPLLDDDGDKQGSNVLYHGADGEQVKTMYLGIGPKYEPNPEPRPTKIVTVTPTLHLTAKDTSAELFATVNHPERVQDSQIIVDIRPPSLQLLTDGTEQKEQLEINNLARIYLNFQEGNRFTGRFEQFDEVGQYEILYLVKDKITAEISPLHRSIVYKTKPDNQSPQPFKLHTPQDGEETATTLILDWENSADPEGEPITYTLIMALDPQFNHEVYRQTGLTMSLAAIDQDTLINDALNESELGLRDGVTYFWQVQAIDKYGAIAESVISSFHTNNTNAPPSISSIQVFSAINFTSLENARLDFWQMDEWGHLILDELGNPMPIIQTPIIYQEHGFYNMLLPYGRRKATIHLAGYQSQEVEIDTTAGSTTLNVAMMPIGGMPINHGQLQFAITQTDIEENRGEINLIVNRVGGFAGEVSVSYETLAGMATADEDYLPTQGKLTWSDQDDRSQKIPLTIINDIQDEENETVTLILHTPTGGATSPTNNQLVVTIIDDDKPNHGQLEFAVNQTDAEENQDEINLVVNRVGGSVGEVSVSYYTLAGTATADEDYLPTQGKLTWLDKDKQSQQIPLTIIDNSKYEEKETVTLVLHTPTGGATLPTNNQLVVTILDNDPIPSKVSTIQFVQPSYHVDEAIGTVSTFTVTRNNSDQGAVSVHYSTYGGTAELGLDYLGGTGTLSWANGDDNPKVIDLTIVDDQLIEEAETIQLRLEDPSADAQLGSYQQATLIIKDNDEEPQVASLQFDSLLYGGYEEDEIIELNVTRTGSTVGDVSVQYVATTNSTAIAGEDYLNSSGTLVWADGEKQAKTITINILDDDYADEEIVHMILLKPTGLAGLGARDETVLHIKDHDELPNIQEVPLARLQFIKSVAFIDEQHNEILIMIMRTGDKSEPITVDYETVNGTAIAYKDYLPRQGQLTWQTDDEEIISITIPILDDLQLEAEESFQVRLSNPSTNAELGIPLQLEVRIVDNDNQPPIFLPSLGQGVTFIYEPTAASELVRSSDFLFCYEPCPIQTAFRGGVSLNGLTYHSSLNLHSSQPVEIIGEIDVDAAHVNQTADILMVAGWKPMQLDNLIHYFMRDNQGQVWEWDMNMTHLIAAQPQVTLAPTQRVAIYSGWLSSGQLSLFFGYRLNDGTVVFNGEQPIEIQVQ